MNKPDTPQRAPLHPDPQIAAALEFTPVPRKTKRPDGWNEARQREFVRRLAETGSPRLACEAMDKNLSGVALLYKARGAESFRAAWDKAMEIGQAARARQARDAGPPFTGQAPGLNPRRPYNRLPDEAGEAAGPDDCEATKLEVVESLVAKMLAKVRAEREARLAGQVVAADFYLRQVTALEVALDLLAHDCGYSGFELLANCRRSGHNLFAIAETPFSRALDTERRRMWAEEGESRPELCRGHGEDGSGRPEHPPRKYLQPFAPSQVEGHDGYSLEPGEALGPASRPPAGVDAEAWAAMGCEAQKAMWAEQHRRDAEAQVAYEAEAKAEFERRQEVGGSTDVKANDGD